MSRPKTRAQLVEEGQERSYTWRRFREWLQDTLFVVPLLFMIGAVLLLTTLGETGREYVTGEFQALGTRLQAQRGLKLAVDDAAIEILASLLERDYFMPLSVNDLRLDPLWDPLREHPGFQQLLNDRSAVVVGGAEDVKVLLLVVLHDHLGSFRIRAGTHDGGKPGGAAVHEFYAPFPEDDVICRAQPDLSCVEVRFFTRQESARLSPYVLVLDDFGRWCLERAQNCQRQSRIAAGRVDGKIRVLSQLRDTLARLPPFPETLLPERCLLDRHTASQHLINCCRSLPHETFSHA